MGRSQRTLNEFSKRLELFFAVDGTRDLRVLGKLDRRVNALLSAGHFWNGRFLRLPRVRFKPPYVRELMVDSGAQQFSRFTDYPYSTEHYIHFCNYVRADYAVSLDYPIDMFEWRNLNYDYRELLEKTVENGVRLHELWKEGELKAKPVLAIQGLENHWFLECLDMYGEYGLLGHRWWGVGSLCMSLYARADKIAKVARLVRRRLGREAHIHVFGPDMDSWERIAGVVDSVDTSMIKYFRKEEKAGFPKVTHFKGWHISDVRRMLGMGDRVTDWEGVYLFTARVILRKIDIINRTRRLG